jgi:hypothetical protein
LGSEKTPVWQWLVRGGVLALAVGVGTFIVRQNHEAAQPQPAAERIQPSDQEAPTAQRRTPESSGRVEGASTKAPEATPEKKPVFFNTSKSMAPPEEFLIVVPTPKPKRKANAPEKPFFHSSKAFEPPPLQIRPPTALPVPR